MVTFSSFTTKIPHGYLEIIDDYWKRSNFSDRSEFVRLCVRFYMEKHKISKMTLPPVELEGERKKRAENE